jgi:hypothetical protein
MAIDAMLIFLMFISSTFYKLFANKNKANTLMGCHYGFTPFIYTVNKSPNALSTHTAAAAAAGDNLLRQNCSNLLPLILIVITSCFLLIHPVKAV